MHESHTKHSFESVCTNHSRKWGCPRRFVRITWSALWHCVFLILRSSAVLTGLFTVTEHHVLQISVRPSERERLYHLSIVMPLWWMDPFRAASDLPEHLFGPEIWPLCRGKIFEPFGSSGWPNLCTYPQNSPLRHIPICTNAINIFCCSLFLYPSKKRL